MEEGKMNQNGMPSLEEMRRAIDATDQLLTTLDKLHRHNPDKANAKLFATFKKDIEELAAELEISLAQLERQKLQAWTAK